MPAASGNLRDRAILLCVCGGIAAYKAVELARRLRDAGADVQVAMTENAQRFVGAQTFQAVSHHPVRTSLWDANAEAAMGHLELAGWAQQVVIAPATANTIARLAHGMADDLVSTLCLATEAPLLLAPAMNHRMWRHPATQAKPDKGSKEHNRDGQRVGARESCQARKESSKQILAKAADL